MSEKYNFKEIEQKWQTRWDETQLFKAVDLPDENNKFYMLVMFAYPSGDIHMGHFRNYIIGDAVARHQMMLGKSVMHPFGWDAFGLPAERAAIERDIHPSDWTLKNVKISRETLQKVGISFDWSREVVTCQTDYYKWTQWMFLKLFENDLAYRKKGFVNWCPEDQTVLANEQVVDGKCDRCGTEVETKEQVQWYFRITKYADRLTDDLDKLPHWPDNVKAMQKEWIGRSYGAEIDFKLEDSNDHISVYTTRPDTIYGVTFMALAPESEIIAELKLDDEKSKEIEAYKQKSLLKTDIDRSSISVEKDGVFTGKYAINPFNGEKVQLWVADYVLAGYGTGVVMGVPAHDERDFAFATKYEIPIVRVISDGERNDNQPLAEAYTSQNKLINSDIFDGTSGSDAIDKIIAHAESNSYGRHKVNYKLKDWSVARQRYWGCPIPIVHCEKCGEQPVPYDQLPVLLPKVDNYQPKGRSPLGDVPEFVKTTCPKCGGEAERDVDTLDTFTCSSWYYLRYCDPHNPSEPFEKLKTDSWLPIDLYIGGITHATGHLLYFRFFQKFLKDLGYLRDDEPVTRLFNHGMVSDSSGEIMSKSLGNVVSPIELMATRGVDVCRLGMYFTAPSDKEVLWSDNSLTGVEKFVLNKIVPLASHYRNSQVDLKCYFKKDELSSDEYAIYVKLNQTIKKSTDAYDKLNFNTAISALMELLRDYNPEKISNDQLNDMILLKAVQIIAPMTPHIAEEIWETCKQDGSIFKSSWPEFDPDAIVGNKIELAVQINGKLRATIEVDADSDKDTVLNIAMENEKVISYTDGKEIIKKIVVPGRLINLVVK